MATSGRHLARRNAVQALYQWDITQQSAASIRSSFIMDERLNEKGQERHLAYFEKLIKEIPSEAETIDKLIAQHADRPVSKLDPLEKSVLRVGAYELLYQIDVPPKVVLNEAIEIAKMFCSDQGYKYVNAVLDKVVKSQAKK
ncbi:MAG: transcription antitermination factor NusB [Arenicellales bacterium]